MTGSVQIHNAVRKNHPTKPPLPDKNDSFESPYGIKNRLKHNAANRDPERKHADRMPVQFPSLCRMTGSSAGRHAVGLIRTHPDGPNKWHKAIIYIIYSMHNIIQILSVINPFFKNLQFLFIMTIYCDYK